MKPASIGSGLLVLSVTITNVCPTSQAENRCIEAVTPTPPAGFTAVRADGMSGNGMCLVGFFTDGLRSQSFVRTSQSIELPPPQIRLVAADQTASAFVGWRMPNSTKEAVLLRANSSSSGYQTTTLPPPPGMGGGIGGYAAKAISQDGSTIVGIAPINGQPRAVCWQLISASGSAEITTTNLGTLQGGNYSSAAGVSQDGSVVVGLATDSNGRHQAFRWSASTGMTQLSLPQGATYAEAAAVNGDGSVVVGDMLSGGHYRAFRWTAETGMQDLGLPAGFDDGWALAVSGDGAVVVGYCLTSQGGSSQRPFIWTAENGTLLLSDFLQTQGFDLSGWTLEAASTISTDGAVIGGHGFFQGSQRGFVIHDLRPRSCPSDLDGDGEVNSADLSLILLEFGSASGCSPDLDGSGEVDAADISIQLLDFGSCP
jgi:probable HAF family extracellular repeat protein